MAIEIYTDLNGCRKLRTCNSLPCCCTSYPDPASVHCVFRGGPMDGFDTTFLVDGNNPPERYDIYSGAFSMPNGLAAYLNFGCDQRSQPSPWAPANWGFTSILAVTSGSYLGYFLFIQDFTQPPASSVFPVNMSCDPFGVKFDVMWYDYTFGSVEIYVDA